MSDDTMTMEEISKRKQEWIENTVPYEWRKVACTCEFPHYTEDLTKCTVCGLYARWLMRKCRVCGEQFLGIYKHHRTTMPRPANFIDISDLGPTYYTVASSELCWDCLTERDPAQEGDSNPEIVLQEVRSLSEILNDTDLFNFDF